MSRRTLVCALFLLAFLVLAGLPPAPTAYAFGTIVVNSLGDTSGRCAQSGRGACTLRDAMSFANLHSGQDTITFGVTGIIALTSSLPAIQDTLTIDGSGQVITVSGGGASGGFTVARGVWVRLKRLTITNAECDPQAGGGGGVTNFGTLNVDQTSFVSNDSTACTGGGGIDNKGGTVTVTNSVFSQNRAVNGGGIANGTDGVLTVSNTTFSGNQATTGGGISNLGTLNVTQSTFSGNSAVGDGGGIANSNGATLKLSNNTFARNQAGKNGGGIYNRYGRVVVANSTFKRNTGWQGGAISNIGGDEASSSSRRVADGDVSVLTVANSTFTANTAGLFGGAVFNDYAQTLNIRNSTVWKNQSGQDGGAIYTFGTATVTNSTFLGNQAPSGAGGAFNNGTPGWLRVINSTVYGNSANQGGGIFDSGNAVFLSNTIVADSSGQDCFLYDDSVHLTADSHNLDTDGSCDQATQTTAPQLTLGPLQDNGGLTQTMKPGAGSPALGGGDNAVCTAAVGDPSYGAGGKDQRGVERPQGAICDVGAVEVRVK